MLSSGRWRAAAVDLKERTLGIAVFGREPSYDTSTDPVVRATAGEIRKRIAQYYQESGREHEIRINLSPGSYVPEFGSAPGGFPARKSTPAGPGGRAHPRYTGDRRALAARSSYRDSPGASHGTRALPWPTSGGRSLESLNAVLICIGQRRFLGTSPEFPNDATPDLEQVRKGPGETRLLPFRFSSSITRAVRISGLTMS